MSDSGRPPKEHRTEPRIEARFRVRFRTLDDLVHTYTQDISQGGLFVRTDHFLPIGSVVQLNLELPDGGEPEAALARVAYTLGPDEAKAQGRNPGMGMEFVELPSTLAERVAAHVTDQLQSPGEGGRAEPATVLVVEDSDAYRQMVASTVEGMGHNVQTAGHGLDALGYIMREPPDLVLCDVNMPVMDGWKLLRTVRSRPRLAGVPVVFLTDLSGEQERLEGYRQGVDDYIGKPFNQEELQIRIDRVLRRSRARPTSSADRGALRGDLALVSLPSVLAFVESERRTGLLMVASEDAVAMLHVREGRVLRVDLSNESQQIQGIDRLFHVLDWTRGWFELSQGDVAEDDHLGASISYALLEHARRQDEGS